MNSGASKWRRVLEEVYAPATADQMDSKDITFNDVGLEGGPKEYLLTWTSRGGTHEQVTVPLSEIYRRFPEWITAVRDCHQLLNPAVPLESFLKLAAYSYCETVPKRQRFLMYRHVALTAGFAERTKLPEQLELAIKNMWCSEEEEFVGFMP